MLSGVEELDRPLQLGGKAPCKSRAATDIKVAVQAAALARALTREQQPVHVGRLSLFHKHVLDALGLSVSNEVDTEARENMMRVRSWPVRSASLSSSRSARPRSLRTDRYSRLIPPEVAPLLPEASERGQAGAGREHDGRSLAVRQ